MPPLAGSAPPDVLGHEPGRPSRRRQVLAVGLVALAVSGYAGDRWASQREVDTLIDRVSAGQVSVLYADRRISGTIAYATPAIGSPKTPPKVRASLRGLVQEAAADRVPVLEDRRRAAAGVFILPWHGAQQRAQAAYVAYLDARVTYVQAVATDLNTLWREHPELAVRRDAAQEALASAAGPRATDRVARAFSPRTTG